MLSNRSDRVLEWDHYHSRQHAWRFCSSLNRISLLGRLVCSFLSAAGMAKHAYKLPLWSYITPRWQQLARTDRPVIVRRPPLGWRRLLTLRPVMLLRLQGVIQTQAYIQREERADSRTRQSTRRHHLSDCMTTVDPTWSPTTSYTLLSPVVRVMSWGRVPLGDTMGIGRM